MGFHITDMQLNALFQTWQTNYHIYAPRNFSGGGRFSDTDCIRYGKIEHADEIVFDKKSDYSFKEVLTPVSQTLFFFTEGQTKEADFPQKGAVIFLRSCDLYALKRLDDMYLHNGPADYYYQHLRDNIKVVLMGCEHSFENCFCVSMGTNVSTKYDMSIDRQPDGTYLVDCKDKAWVKQLVQAGCEQQEVIPAHVTENQVTVQVPENLTAEVAKSTMWEEYNSRCINCGRCNFVCPTCTCFTMQDLFYSENVGLVTQYIPQIKLDNVQNTVAVVVGPPAMMRFSVQGLLDIGLPEENVWISQERKMCCGLGKCGHCKIGDTYVCLDGPVFNYTKGKFLVD